MTDTTTPSSVERPRGLDARYYTDPAVFERELDHIFARAWQLVGHESQLAEHGQLITATIGREPILVANDHGAIHGFYNVCQHRGHELVAPGTTALPVIICPYHAWTYDLAGQLVRARRSEVGSICVPRIRVDVLAGFVFVNLDPEAAPLAETVPGVADEILALAPDARQRVLTARITHEFPANWKLAVENYNECYHCPNVHKAFTSGVIDPTTFMITPVGNTIRHTAVGIPADRAGYARSVDDDGYGSWFTWPVSSIQCYPGRVLNTFRWIPIAVDRTLLIREWWFDSADPTVDQQRVIDLDWTTTVSEDFDLMASVQRGVASRGYVPGPLIVDPSGTADVHAENAVPHLHSLLLAALGDHE